MDVPGRLQIKVAGERWFPVKTLAVCRPKDRCYVVRIDEDGVATIVFGDGTTGRRPPARAKVEARYQRGSGKGGNAGSRKSRNSGAALVELWARIGDLLAGYQDQIASEAHLETDGERTSLGDMTGLKRAIRGSHGHVEVCLCLRPLTHRETQNP